MLVGRQAEQLVIDRLVAGARIGQSGVLVLTGEPGIGKTALLDYAVGLTEAMRVLRVTGTEPEKDVGFGGLLQLVQPALHLLDHIPAPQAEALEVALALREGPAPDRFAVGAATLSLLSRFADERPLLLLVDDAQALDGPSAEALAFVARRLMADPLAILISSRPEPGTPLLDSGLSQLVLCGLTAESVAELAAAEAGTQIAPEVSAALHTATAGNPLAVVELARDPETLDRLTPQSLVPVPEAVLGSFMRRAGMLSAGTRSALLLAAVADGDLGLVARSAGVLDTSVEDLAAAEEAGLVVVSAGRLTFRHPLVRSGVYAAAAPDLRRRAHRAVAHALPESDLERRAWNLCEATLGVDDAVADLLDEVGRRALGRGANAVAATAWERAALLSPVEQPRARRFLAAADAAWLAGQADRAVALLEGATGLTADRTLLAGMEGLRGTIGMRAGSLEDARRTLRRAADLVRSVDPDAAVILLGDAVMTCFFMGDAITGLEASAEVEELLPRTTSDPARIRGEMTVGMAGVLAGQPGIDRIREAVEGLLALPGLVDDPRRPAWMVIGPLFLRESETGRALVRHAVEDLRNRTALGALPGLLFLTSRDDATTDRWESARTGYAEGVRLARETGQTTDLAMCLAGLTWLQARTGPEDECRRNADEAMALARRHQIHLARAWVIFALGELELGLDEPVRAIAHFEELDRLLSDIGVLDVDLAPGPERAELLLRVGRPADARAAALGYHARAVAKGQPWALARAERALAMTTEPKEQEAHFDRALSLHRTSPDTFEEGRTLLAYGAALRRGRHRVAARGRLRSSLDAFDRVGARTWADVAVRELRATGETAHRRGDSSIDLLTPQELQIARMLGSGRTTREAAAALFLSPKTVEYHLRHVYSKLGIRSRAELSSALEQGLEQT
ncbi:MAG TPA: LuxR C-terminal-related transcriptional regulator [Nocardioidaceae bacterium]|nr:LuxR C-terminal-related transcriptional regulator [Nocardioidaceae bacterium]